MSAFVFSLSFFFVFERAAHYRVSFIPQKKTCISARGLPISAEAFTALHTSARAFPTLAGALPVSVNVSFYLIFFLTPALHSMPFEESIRLLNVGISAGAFPT